MSFGFVYHVSPTIIKIIRQKEKLIMTNTEIRVATNNIKVAGAVKEQKLEIKDGEYKSGDKKGQKYTYITGKLVIKAGESKEITLKCRANQLTNKGETNKTFETLSKFMDGTYVTMATPNVTEEEATKVSVWGNGDFAPQIEDNIFVIEGEVKESIAFKLGFGRLTIKDNLALEDYKAEFEVEMYVKSVEPEMKDEQPTGRTIVKGAVPMYGGTAMPISVIAEDMMDGDEVIPFAEQVQCGVYEGQTFVFWGDIRYERIEKKVTKGGSLGRAKTETEVTTVKEFVAVGGDIVDDMEKAYTAEQIQAANIEREQKKVNAVKEWEEKQAKEGQAKKGKGLGGVSAPKAPVAGAKPTMPTPPKPMGATAPVKPVMPPKPTMTGKVGF